MQIRIRDFVYTATGGIRESPPGWKKSDQGSGINIPLPVTCPIEAYCALNDIPVCCRHSHFVPYRTTLFRIGKICNTNVEKIITGTTPSVIWLTLGVNYLASSGRPVSSQQGISLSMFPQRQRMLVVLGHAGHGPINQTTRQRPPTVLVRMKHVG